MPTLPQRMLAEFVGSALLLAVVIGSGIMADRLAGPHAAVALLANSLATGAGLTALILAFGPLSGAHFNAAVSVADAAQGGLPWRQVPAYLVAQCAGSIAGVAVANVMFDLPALTLSHHRRTGQGQWLGEVVATFGLVLIIALISRARAAAVPFAVGLYITAGYWFTSSTSFANPSATLARAFTDTYGGIALADVPEFALAELAGAGLAVAALRVWPKPT